MHDVILKPGELLPLSSRWIVRTSSVCVKSGGFQGSSDMPLQS
jgi:hypothetical protein